MVCIALLHPFVKVRKTFTNAFDRIRERKVDEGVKKIKMKDDNFRPCWIMFLKNVISRSLQDGPID